MKFVGVFLISLFSLATLWLARPAYAQAPIDVTEEIQTGLCAGSNLDLSGKCRAQSNDTAKKLSNFIRRIINILSAVVGIVAVIMIIVGGFRYITSGGNDTSVTGAKNTILYAIIGLIIVAMAQIIVHFVLKRLAQ